MPTGYTAAIERGTTFKNFVLHCARAHLISMRDDPLDAEIPDVVHPDRYHFNSAQEALIRLGKLKVLTVEQAKDKADKEFKEETRVYEGNLKQHKKVKALYDAMLKQVQSWQPPTPDHQELKEFMIQQINISKPNEYYRRKPRRKSGQSWLKTQIEEATSDLAYHEGKYAEEVVSCTKSTAWIKALKRSLEG